MAEMPLALAASSPSLRIDGAIGEQVTQKILGIV
jgi:hypothetical protein